MSFGFLSSGITLMSHERDIPGTARGRTEIPQKNGRLTNLPTSPLFSEALQLLAQPGGRKNAKNDVVWVPG